MSQSDTKEPMTTDQAEMPTFRIQPTLDFPKDGEYVVFVDFQPTGGDKQTLVLPLTVGMASPPVGAQPGNESRTQSIGDLKLTLNGADVLNANQVADINFDVVDAQGKPVTDEIGWMSGSMLALQVLDEELTSYQRPAVVNADHLEFSVTFPKPGRYKIWLEFVYEGKFLQAPFVVEVK